MIPLTNTTVNKRLRRELSLSISSCEDVHYMSAPDLHFRKNTNNKVTNGGDQQKKEVTTEEKHSWVVLIAVLCFNIISGYHFLCFGFYYVIFSDVFGTSKAVTGLINSITGGVASVCAIFSSVFIDIYGARRVAIVGVLITFIGVFTSAFSQNVYMLFVTYGALTGFGAGMSGLSSTVIVQQNFNKHRNLATSIAMCGIPLGSILSPFITNLLLNTFGWRGALLIQSGICLQSLILVLTFTPPKITNKPKTTDSQTSVKFVQNLLDFSILKNVVFILFSLALMCLRFNLGALVNHLPSRIVYFGGDLEFAGYLSTIIWISSLACRLSCIVVSAFDLFFPLVGIIGVVLTEGICAIALPFCTSNIAQMIVVGIFGCAQGFLGPCIILSTVKLFGVPKFARSRAVSSLIASVGTFAATPVTGWIFDVTQNYDLPFYFSGTVGIIGACLYALIAIIHILCKKESESNIKVEVTDEFLGEHANRVRTNTC